MNSFINHFRKRGQQLCQFCGAEGRFYIRKKFNSKSQSASFTGTPTWPLFLCSGHQMAELAELADLASCEAPFLVVDFKHAFKVTCINVIQQIFFTLMSRRLRLSNKVDLINRQSSFFVLIRCLLISLYFVTNCFLVNLIVTHFSQKIRFCLNTDNLALIIVFTANLLSHRGL